MRWILLGVLSLFISYVAYTEEHTFYPRRPYAESVPAYGFPFGACDPTRPVNGGRGTTYPPIDGISYPPASSPAMTSTPATATAEPSSSASAASDPDPVESPHSPLAAVASTDDTATVERDRAPATEEQAPAPVEQTVDRPLSETDHRMATFFKGQRCVSCHGPNPTAKQLFDKDGHALNPDLILDLFEGKISVPASMRAILKKAQDHLKSHSADLENLRAWAKENGRENFALEGAPVESTTPATPAEPVSLSTRKPGEIPRSIDQAIIWDLLSLTNLVKPAELKEKLERTHKPIVVNIGSLNDFLIKDTTMIGPINGDFARNADEAKARLDKLLALAPDKSQEIIIYCGCCEINMCPNVLGALAKLKDLGYTNVKVVDMLPYDFTEDWSKTTGLELQSSP